MSAFITTAAVTTATMVVCGKCGRVSHIEGTVQPQAVLLESCQGASAEHRHGPGQHSWKYVLVVIPWA